MHQKKYLFLLPNGVTYFVALRVIEFLDIPENECLLVSTRNFLVNNLHFCSQKLPFEYSDFPHTWRFHEAKESVVKFDKWIESNATRGFFVFLPHHGMPYYSLITSHPKCEGFSYIEEGTFSYYDYEELFDLFPVNTYTFLQRVRRWACYGKRIPSQNTPFRKEYKSVFRISHKAFPWSDRPIDLCRNIKNHNSDLFAGKVVLVLRPEYDRFWTRRSTSRSINKMCKWLQKNKKNVVLLKTHPSTEKTSMLFRDVLELLSKNNYVKTVILDNSFVIENFIFQGDGVIVSQGSSSDYYAILSNCEFYSLFNFRDEDDQLIEPYLNALPRVQRDKVAKALKNRIDSVTT